MSNVDWDPPLEDLTANRLPCGWCGGETCDGAEQKYPHHLTCCLDGQPRPCWTTYRNDTDAASESVLARIMREDREAREER